MSNAATDIRNVVFIGHGGTGKTSMIDVLAHLAGATGRIGSVEQGTSICDYEFEELERKHSFRAAVVHGAVDATQINLVDTPGYPDFLAESIASLSACETAAVVIASTSKITFTTRMLWERATQAGVAKVIVVTRSEAENTDFPALYEEIKATFGDKCVPVTFPDGNGAAFSAILNILERKDIAQAHGDRVEEYYTTLVERVAESDDELMMSYLDEGEITHEQLIEYLGKAIAAESLIPILTVDAKAQKGTRELLDFLVHFAPAPDSRGPLRARQGDEEIAIAPDPQAPALAQVWKIVSDQHVGRITYLRIWAGTLESHSELFRPNSNKPLKLNGLNVLIGREGLKPVESAGPGSLVAITKVEDLGYGDVLGAQAPLPELPAPEYPHPWTSFAVNTAKQGDDQKMGEGLRRLSAEDPTFVIRREESTNEFLIDGLSDLHVQIVLDRLKQRSKVEVQTSLPKIPYKETIAAKAEGHHRHKKQSGGRGQFGECFLRVAPRTRGEGFEFIDKVVGGAIPRNLIPAVEKGIREEMKHGPQAGCEVVDISVEVYDGKFHPVDSDEASFKMAGGRAFRDGFLKARPIILEPIYNVEIRVPSRFMGDITSDVNSRRGQIVGMDAVGDLQIIKAQIPLVEVQTYSAQLRSITAGEGIYSMSYSGYEQVPPHIQEKIIAAHQKAQKGE